jgi:hypothetical protein
MSGTRRIAAVVFLLGLSTCFLPLFSVSPPALGKTEWSAWDIFKLIASGPNPVEWLLQTRIIRLWAVYAALASGLLLLWLPQYLKAVSICTIVSLGFIGGVLNVYSFTFSRLFERQAGWHGGTLIANPEAYVLPALLVFLLFVLAIELKIRPRPGEP